MSAARTGRRPGPAALPWLVAGFGCLSFAVTLLRWLWFSSILDVTAYALSFATVGVPALGLVWGGYRLERSGLAPERYGRVLFWWIGGAVGFLIVNLAVMVFFPWPNLAGNLAWAHFSINAGAVAGFAVGYVEARAIQREVEATAAAVRAEQLEAEREVLAYLNDLLRHEVLNSAQIIGGHTSLLLEDAEGRRRSHLETIDRESDALTDVIDDVRALLDATRNPDLSAAVDVADLLREEAAALERRYEGAEIDVAVRDPEPVLVEGNEGIRWIFANVLENAIEHNEGDPVRAEVTVETAPETVVVRVADNGPGIPPETRETLFERKSENHGLGLYFVRILATRYGGTVELTATGPDGSTFTVTLPRATDPTDGADDGATARDDPLEATDDDPTDPDDGTEPRNGNAETNQLPETETESDDSTAGTT